MAFYYRLTWRAAFAIVTGMVGGSAVAVIWSHHGLVWLLGTFAGYAVGFAIAEFAGWIPRRW